MFRRRRRARAGCRSPSATPTSAAASTSRRRRPARTSTSATTRGPTARISRCGSAAARRSTSGRTRPSSPSTRSGGTLTPAEVSSYWTGRAFDFIVVAAGRLAELMMRKIALLVNAAEMVDTESQETHAEWSLPLRLLGPIGHFGVLVPLASSASIATWSGSRSRLWLLYAMTGGLRGERRRLLRLRALSLSAGPVPDAVRRRRTGGAPGRRSDTRGSGRHARQSRRSPWRRSSRTGRCCPPHGCGP